MNETLEAMARRLFKSWFVDFDPVHAKAALRREHPKLSNADLSRRALPNMAPEIAELFPDSFEDSTLGPIPTGWKLEPLESLASISGGKQLPTADCLASARYPVYGANGVMGHATRSTHEGFVLQAMLATDFSAMRTGSAQPFIPNSSLSASPIVVPVREIAEAFETAAGSEAVQVCESSTAHVP